MLTKLLKYEFKATARGILPIYAALLGFALIVRIFVTNNTIIGNAFLSNLFKTLSAFLYGATLGAMVVATLLLIIQRFYKNLLGDEGYLMHTLPVSTNKNIMSKLISSTIWCCFSIIIGILSIIILFSTKDFLFSFFSEFSNLMSECFLRFKFCIILVIIEIIIATLLQFASNIILIYSSISIGHLLPKMKVLGSFAAYLALNVALSTVVYSFMKVYFFIPYLQTFFDNLALNSPITFFHVVMLILIAINLIQIIIFYILTHYILKNKLNLE